MNLQAHDIRVAVLDLNNGYPNQGMGNIREILQRYAIDNGIRLHVEEFDVRQRQELPDTSFNVYISSGGPGSPFEDEGTVWETTYFKLIGDLCAHNESALPGDRKFVFFICHSFQLACRYFRVGNVCLRKSTSFGVFPTHKTLAGQSERLFAQLPEPFYTVDSRDWQVVEVDQQHLRAISAEILAIEKERPHVPLDRAVMAIRFSPEMIGTQFHPEADANGMRKHLLDETRKQKVIEQHGLAKYEDMMLHLEDPDKIMLTQHLVIPTFLDVAFQSCYETQEAAV